MPEKSCLNRMHLIAGLLFSCLLGVFTVRQMQGSAWNEQKVEEFAGSYLARSIEKGTSGVPSDFQSYASGKLHGRGLPLPPDFGVAFSSAEAFAPRGGFQVSRTIRRAKRLIPRKKQHKTM